MAKGYRIKRILDVLLVIPAIILLVPVWLLLSLCVFIENPGPVIFRQVRLGKDEKLFTLYKFRSMYTNNIPPLDLGAVKHNHALVTRVGYFIRRLKLDETPQLLNILKGDMSLVGPRPCLPARSQTMPLEEKRRFSFLPGLTGWAEVNGNVELSWEEQLLLDLWYVDHWSLFLDFKIILKTIVVVFFGSTRNEVALMLAKRNLNKTSI